MKAWFNPPVAPSSMPVLAGAFEEFFGRPWLGVMMDGALPFAHHLGWETYLAVSELSPVHGLLLPDLVGSASEGARPLNLIIG